MEEAQSITILLREKQADGYWHNYTEIEVSRIPVVGEYVDADTADKTGLRRVLLVVHAPFGMPAAADVYVSEGVNEQEMQRRELESEP